MHAYRNTATHASPTWSLVSEIGDLSVADLEMGMAELKRRASGYTKNLATLLQTVSIEFDLFHGMDVTNFDAIRTAFFAGTPMEWAIMDGPIASDGSEGLVAPMLVNQFPWDQSLEEVSRHNIRMALAYMVEAAAEVEPSWMVVDIP
jgi:hypothetical protein